MTDPRSILFSFAHPDDESFLVSGIASMYSSEGVHVVLSTATLGEAGKTGEPPVCTREQLPAVRKAELRNAAGLIGLGEPILLGYRDRELASAPVEEIRRKLVAIIRQHRPQVVVTFDPNGANGHPDHVAISRFTSDAIAAAADGRWFPEAGAPHAVSRLVWPPPVRPWSLARVSETGGQPGFDFVFDIRRWSERKAQALRAHRSQHLSVNRVFFSQPDVERLLGVEAFRQAFGPPLSTRPADDLFTGIAVMEPAAAPR
jgi:LmbE family N-acetylglucosaminyl deacetylase